MKITSIKQSRRVPDRVYISFLNGPFIPLYVDDYVTQKYTAGQDLTDEQLEKIINLSLNYLSWEYSLRQLGLTPKTEKILKNKLSLFLRKAIIKYKINTKINSEEIINNCINRLKQKNLIDDLKFIEYFIKKNKHKSQRELSFLLSGRGIDPRLVPTHLWSQSNDLVVIKKIISKKIHNKEDLLNPLKKTKLMTSLYRKGFLLSDINNAIDDYSNS